MGERFFGNWRVLAAAVFSAVLIVGAALLARGIESPPLAQASAETALLQAIAAKDSDGDGLPDWEEALYGTDPRNPDSLHLGMTDGEAVAKGLIVPKAIANVPAATSSPDASAVVDSSLPPAPAAGTITDTFAKNFFSLYVSAKQANGGADLSPSDAQAIATQAMGSLSSSVMVAPDFKSMNDLVAYGTGADALRSFAVDAEAVFKANTSNATTSEIVYLQYAVQNNDTAALVRLASIAKAYRNTAAGLSALIVPRELAANELALVNALMRVSEIINDFARVDTDPMTTMLALEQYLPAAQALGKAFTDIGNTYAAAGIALPAGAPGASFVNVAAAAAARQRAALGTL